MESFGLSTTSVARGYDGSQPPPVVPVSKVRMPKLEHKEVQCILTTLQVENETIDAEDLINIQASCFFIICVGHFSTTADFKSEHFYFFYGTN